MFEARFCTGRRGLIGILASALAPTAFGQATAPQPPSAAEGTAAALSAQLIKTGLYSISGGGGNTLLRFSASGLVLINAKSPGTYRALRSAVRKVGKLADMPVRALVLTDHHPQHAGNSAQFRAAGVAIIAQQNASAFLEADAPNGERPPGPLITFDREYQLRIGGVELQVLHFGHAQTSDCAVVYFPDKRVVAVGDLFTPATPAPDFAAGGSLVGWVQVLAEVLKLDIDVVVPSLGTPVARTELEAFKTRMESLVARAAALVRQGVAQDKFNAQLRTDDLGWRFNFTATELVALYADLSKIP